MLTKTKQFVASAMSRHCYSKAVQFSASMVHGVYAVFNFHVVCHMKLHDA